MNAQELRLGNWLHLTDEIYFQVDYDFFDQIKGDDKELDSYAIPITEEWLLKFGFKQVMKKENYITYKLDNIKVAIYPDFIDMRHIPIRSRQLQYVHQLQNLYFALTGKELTIKQ